MQSLASTIFNCMNKRWNSSQEIHFTYNSTERRKKDQRKGGKTIQKMLFSELLGGWQGNFLSVGIDSAMTLHWLDLRRPPSKSSGEATLGYQTCTHYGSSSALLWQGPGDWAMPSQAKQSQAKPSQAKANKIKPNWTNPNQTNPNQNKQNQAKLSQSETSQAKPN